MTTRDVTEMLGLNRQALDSHKRTGSVLALPGEGTSHRQTWQFDIDGSKTSIRPITLQIVTAFREQVVEVSPNTIAAWATSPQREPEPVVFAARRAAHQGAR